MVDVAQPDSPARPDDTERPVRDWVDGVLVGIFALRVPIVLGIITVVALTVPDQVREIHRILTQERIEKFFNQHWVLCVASLVALSIVLWQSSRQHAEDYLNDWPADARLHSTTRWILTWGPRALATLPLLAAAVGIWISRLTTVNVEDLKDEEIPPPLRQILEQQLGLYQAFAIGALICLLLAVVVFVIATLFERNLAPVGSKRVRTVAIVNNWLFFPVLILASIGLLIYYPVWLPQQLGSIPIFALWMANLAVLFTLLWRYSRLVGVPILLVLGGLLVLFEVSGLNDNHRFRHSVPTVDIERPSVAEAFRTWIGSRADLDAYKAAGKKYPLYIVAAEGGGLYAAYQTAKLLGRMQDLCPNFAQHVFMISAVSGGSLGAGVFSGLAQGAANAPLQPCAASLAKPGAFETAADGILSRDLLSPVIWGTLFPDFLQRFVPYPFSKLDRGYALELAFEKAWEEAGPKTKNPLASSFYKLCGENSASCAKGAGPSLALNVTNVETGMQMVLSHMDMNNWPFIEKPGDRPPPRLFDIFANNVPPVELQLSTAVGLSARFPWISPQGWYSFYDTDTRPGRKSGWRRMSFVDGGYVDNSGVATATKIARLIQYTAEQDKTLPEVEVKLIVISAAWIPFERYWIDPPTNKALSEYVSPLVAALAAWQGRGFTAQSDVTADQMFRVIDMGVYYNFMPLTVGWHLSNSSRKYIDLFRGDPEKCLPERTSGTVSNHAAMAGAYIYKANCAAAEIRQDLTPK